MWFANDFLAKKLPHMMNSLDKKAVMTVTAARTQWLNAKIASLLK